MVTRAPAESQPARRRVDVTAILAVVGMSVATMATLVIDADPVLVLIPVVGFGVIYVVFKIPLRWSTTAIVATLLAVDIGQNPVEIWSTPLSPIAVTLKSVSDLLALALLGVAAYRRRTYSTLDQPHVGAPSVIRWALLAFGAATVFAIGMGIANGLSVTPWKIRLLSHPIIFFLLFHEAYRGPADFRAAGITIVVAAHSKAVMAYIIQRVAIAETGGKLQHATSHGDSVLFAIAILIVILAALEKPGRRSRYWLALLVPVPIVGIIENDRRLAWGMLEMGLAFTFLIVPWVAWKRRLTRAMLLAAPLVAIYLGIGWNMQNPSLLFVPVAEARSMLESNSEGTLWRDIESWNIAMSIRESSVLGRGIAAEYSEYMMNDDISSVYKEYKAWPHNIVLHQMLMFGLFGFMAYWLPWVLTVYFAMLAYRFAHSAYERIACLSCVCAVACCTALSWGDGGPVFHQHPLIAGLALALAGKLAVVTGAWPGGASTARPV